MRHFRGIGVRVEAGSISKKWLCLKTALEDDDTSTVHLDQISMREVTLSETTANSLTINHEL